MKNLYTKKINIENIKEEKHNFDISIRDYLLQKLGRDVVGEIRKYLYGKEKSIFDDSDKCSSA